MNELDTTSFGSVLRFFRQRKDMTQLHLAEKIEVHVNSVSLWERELERPESHSVVLKIAEILLLDEEDKRLLFEARYGTASILPLYNLPSERNPYFTGRSPQLADLHILLMKGKKVALTQAISGLGGIGKTQLALEYAHRYQKSYHDIFWASADTYNALMTSYARLAVLLHLPEYDEQDQIKVKAAVQRWLSNHKGWLLILDNIEDLSLINQFVPKAHLGAVLLTTRRRVTERVAQALELELLPENDAILFLLKRTKVLDFEMSLEDAADRDILDARAITQLLGNLPLALDQAGAYILETPCSFEDYLDLFRKHQAQLLERRIGEGIPTDHPDSVTATFRLNFQQVQQRSNAAGEILRFCAFLAPDSIPEEILITAASSLGPVLSPLAEDTFRRNQAIEVLQAYSLVRRDPKRKTLSIHRLVQAVLKDTLEETERHTWAERAILAVNTVFPHSEPDTWLQCEPLLPHALIAAQHIEMDQTFDKEGGRLLHETASYLHDRARYSDAEPLYQRALQIRERYWGLEHPEVAQSLNGLAELYREQGRFSDAKPLYQRVLQVRERYWGLEHPEVAQSLNNLANFYYQQTRFSDAEPLYQRALYIFEKCLGREHLHMAYPLNGLATLYRDQKKYADAEPLFKRSLHIFEKCLGREHLQVAIPLNNLAELYRDQGKSSEAEPLFQRALMINKGALGPEHPEVALSLNNVADLYRDQGKSSEAEPLYQRALAIWEQHLGLEHYKVAYPLNSLARLSFEQGKYGEAEQLLQRALGIREKARGPKHPETAETMYSLAQLREAQGDKEQAKVWYTRALDVCEQALGAHHPKTTDIRTRLIALTCAGAG